MQKEKAPYAADKDYDYLFKVVLIGDSGVGKSNFLLRFSDDQFTDTYISTIGVDFRFRTISVDGQVIKLQIWDTAGQERFRTITHAYYRGADGIIIVYDTTEKDSFKNIRDWIDEVNRYSAEDTCRMLVANKKDKVDERVVSVEEGQQRAAELNIPLQEVSARTGENVDRVFEDLARRLVARRDSQQRQQGMGANIVLNPNRSTPANSTLQNCCNV